MTNASVSPTRAGSVLQFNATPMDLVAEPSVPSSETRSAKVGASLLMARDALLYAAGLAAAPVAIETLPNMILANPTPMGIVGGAIALGVCAFWTAQTVGHTIEDVAPLVPRSTPEPIQPYQNAQVGSALSLPAAYAIAIQSAPGARAPITFVGKMLRARHLDKQQENPTSAVSVRKMGR